MRISTLAAAIAVSVAVTIPLTGVAFAGGDRNCSEFSSKSEAQKALDAGTGSKSLLDPDGDGKACASSKDKDDKDKDDKKDSGSKDKDKKDKDKKDKDKDDKDQVKVTPKG